MGYGLVHQELLAMLGGSEKQFMHSRYICFKINFSYLLERRHFQEENVFFLLEYTFKPGFCPQKQLRHLIMISCVFIDLEKAYDRVPREEV